MSRERAWIGLGSNLEDPAAQVAAGMAALSGLPDTEPGPASSLYRSAPEGVTDQPAFCNAVAAVVTGLEPHALLAELHAIEELHGRVRDRRWGPRTLDLDLLLHGDRRIDDPALKVPHPRLHERVFVLVPLAEVAPDLMVPGHGPVATLAAAFDADAIAWWPSA